MQEKKCISGKNTYETESDAEKAVSLSLFLRKIKLRTYLCLDCHKFHLTSGSEPPKKRKKKS